MSKAHRCEEARLLQKISIKAEHNVWERKQSFCPGWVCDLPSFIYPSLIGNVYIIRWFVCSHVNNLTLEIVTIYMFM